MQCSQGDSLGGVQRVPHNGSNGTEAGTPWKELGPQRSLAMADHLTDPTGLLPFALV